MKSFALVAIFCGVAMTAPAAEPALLGINVGGSSSPLLGVSVGGSTVIAVGGASSPKSTSATITAAPTSAMANPTGLPATFSAPVQGQGTLSLKNLPALPAVLDKSFSGVLGTVYVSGACNQDNKCSITVAGTIQSLLVDGDNYAASTTITAWCDGGRCYGSANPTASATAPFTITCDRVTGTNACSATIAGTLEAIFTNGQQVEAWGWLTPSGYCQNGVCTASIAAIGDPMY